MVDMLAAPEVQDQALGEPRRQPRSFWLRRAAVAGVIGLVLVEIILAWPSLIAALSQLRTPRPGWLAAAVGLELAAMTAYGRLQRRLLISAGVRAPLRQHVALAYAAHALSATLPAGPAFSTSFNYQRMRRFGATPAVASWAIALSAILSAAALAVITAVAALTAHGTPPWWSLAGLALAAAAITLGVQRISHRPDTLASVLARVNRLARRPAGSGLDRVRDFTGQLRAARLTPRHGAAAVVHALLNWLFDAACLWMCSRAVGDAPLSPTAILFAFCAAMSVGTLTIVPGGLGVIDSALVLGLTGGGATLPAAIAIAALYRLISFGLIVGAGWIIWSVTRRTEAAAIAR